MHIDATSASFQKDVLDASKETLVFVDFWAPWCGPCRAIAPILDEISSDPAYQGKVQIVKVNVDDHGDLAEKYEIMGIPNMKFFKNGEVTGEVTGLRPKEDLLAAIDAQLHG